MITSDTAATDRRPRVLCVDDDAFMLSILTRTIGADYEVLTSSGGADALQVELYTIAALADDEALT